MTTSYISQLDEPTLDDFTKIIENEKPNTIVLLCETEWHVRELTPELANLLNSHNIKLIVTVCSYPSDYYKSLTQHFNDIEIVHWYTYWINWTMMCSNHLDFDRTYSSFKYPFICLNNKNHVHRCMIVDELTGQGILDKGVVTWNKFPMRERNPYSFKYYDDNIRLLTDEFETKLDSFLIPEEYHQSFLHVIGEATTAVTCISEKTWLPILFKKPFVIMADPGFHQKLVDLGFQLYDEIIDYSFDTEPDMLRRAEIIARNVKNISEQDTTKLYDRIRPKAEHNYKNYLRIMSDINYVPEVIKERVRMLKSDKTLRRNATDGRYEFMYQKMGVRDYVVWDNQLGEKIQQLYDNPKDVTHIIYNGVFEFDSNRIHGNLDRYSELVEFSKQHDIQLSLISASHPDDRLVSDGYTDITYWPTFWLTLTNSRTMNSPNYQLNKSICLDITDPRVGEHLPLKYPYISMNKRPKVHRAIMMDMLAKHELIDKGVVIWRETSSYIFEYWKQEIMLRDQKNKFVSQETLPVEYSMAFMQLVPETDDTKFGLSEKTAMPLFFNKPFLVAGSVNYHRKLQNLGFQLYDELFDYSFDSVNDVKTRYEMIAENVKRYSNMSPEQLKVLYQSVFEKCVYNKRLAHRLATDTRLVPSIWYELIEQQMRTGQEDRPAKEILDFMKKYENEFREI